MVLFVVLNFVPERCEAQYNKRYISWASRNMLASDNYKEAIDILNVLLRSDKESYEAYYLRGYAKLGLGDLLGAEQDLSRSLEINPVYTEAFHYRGIVRSEMGKGTTIRVTLERKEGDE